MPGKYKSPSCLSGDFRYIREQFSEDAFGWNYTPDELSAIAYGYTQLLQESSDVLEEMKSVVNINGLSMSDKERMDVIDRTYNAIRNYRDLVSYYTRKNISVSYLRAKKKKDTDRVMALYGSVDERYW